MSEPAASPEKGGKAGWITTVAAAIGFLLVLGYGFLGQRPLKGGPAPDFTLLLFDGGELSLKELRGQVVVVNFWASWCLPCRREAPVLERVWREYEGQGVIFIGVNVKDIAARATAFVEEFGITYPNGPEPHNRIWRAYRVTGVPETFFITRDGQVAERHIGSISEAALTTMLEELLQR